MQAAVNGRLISVEDYLAGEETSETRHEYAGGAVYAMAGASKEHNLIALNIYTALRLGIRAPCRAFVSEVKVRLQALQEDIFYYPDVMVACDPRDTHRLFSSYPKVLIEVSSPATERLDRREKRWAYQTIETLEECVIVSQDRLEATLFRRAEDWTAEVFSGLNESLPLRSVALKLPLSMIYEGVSIAHTP